MLKKIAFLCLVALACLLVSCGAPAHTHQYGEWTTIADATCTEAGSRERACTCGEKQSEPIDKKEHSAGEWTVAKKASCLEDGSEQRACADCGAVLEERAIPKTNEHTYDHEIDAVCNVCGFQRTTACVHDSVIVLAAKTPTCKADGLTEGKVCADCETVIVLQTVIPALPHTEVLLPGKTATCEQEGLTEGLMCSVCQTVLVEQTVVSAAHADADDNGLCDKCRKSVIVILDFYAINDLHGKMSDTESQPGVDELTTYLKNAEETDDYVIVLASGDMWQGTSESNLTRGKMMTEWLNAIGAVSMTLGNHEFDWANDYIRSNIALAEFPFLAINIYDRATGERVDFAEPSVTVVRGGARIGIIGAIGDCHSSISQDKVAGIEFKVGRELSALVKAEAERLRAQGCDYIVFSVHDGVEYSGSGTVSDREIEAFYDVALSEGSVDLVFEAHTHQNYVLRDSKGVYHIQAGGENTAISHAEIRLNFVNDKSTVTVAETVRSYIYDDCESDDVIDELKEKYEKEIAKGYEKLGTLKSGVDGDVLRQICADIYLEKGLAEWGEDYDIVLAGGYIGIRSPYRLYAGEVLYEDVYSLFPFDNALYLCSISGYNLKNKFINTSNENYFICTSDYGKSITVNNTATYYLITDAYSAFYAPNQLTILEKYSDEELFARDMIAEYIKNGGFGAEDDPSDGSGTEIDTVTVTRISDILYDIYMAGVNVEVGPYFVLGTIVDDPQATYGNCTICDPFGQEIYIYGLYGESGGRYDTLAYQPKKGDTVIVFGGALLYRKDAESTPIAELKNVRVQKVFETTALSEANAIGNALADNASTAEEHIVYGRIDWLINETYGNAYITDHTIEDLYIYGLYDASGSVRYDSFDVKPEEGDIILVQGHIKKYVKEGEAPIVEIQKAKLILLAFVR